MEDYDENSIKILTRQQAGKQFHYALVEQLAIEYPSKSPEFIGRLVLASDCSGYPLEMAGGRYLKGDRSIKVTDELPA